MTTARYDAPIAGRTGAELEALSTLAVFDGVKVATRVIPARGALLGGDWCETFNVTGHLVALSIGDTAGHGAGAFEAMVGARQTVREAAMQGLTPALVLASLNRFLCREQQESYVTAIFALLNTEKRTLAYANAGHPAPLLMGPAEQRFLEFAETDLPLGVDAAAIPTARSVNAPPDSLFVFYTDGLTDCDRDTWAGRERLCNAASLAFHHSDRPAAATIERQMFVAGSNRDDVAILTLRITPPIGATR